MNKILVVAAHSDDEALGCGGTLALEARGGARIRIVFLTDGVGARDVDGTNEAAVRRREASRKAAGLLGAEGVVQLDFSDNRLDAVPLLNIVQPLEAEIATFKPNVILTHFQSDLNVDHRICHQAVMTACRPQPGHCVKLILAFEVASSTEWAFSSTTFSPNYFVDITHTLDTKLSALSAYMEEMRKWPHPRSIAAVETLARWRGATVGVESAEAFMTIRKIASGV